MGQPQDEGGLVVYELCAEVPGAGEAECLLMQRVGMMADRLAAGMRAEGAFGPGKGSFRVVLRVEATV